MRIEDVKLGDRANAQQGNNALKKVRCQLQRIARRGCGYIDKEGPLESARTFTARSWLLEKTTKILITCRNIQVINNLAQLPIARPLASMQHGKPGGQHNFKRF